MKLDIDWRRKISSRKFWALISALVVSCLVAFGVDAGTTEKVVGVITAAGACVTYILAEARVDAESVKQNDYGTEHIE